MPKKINKTVYLDFAATAPTDDRVVSSMLPYFSREFYNPSALYSPSQKVKKAVDQARSEIANFLGAKSAEVIFTSGGTESDNLAIQGVINSVIPGLNSRIQGNLDSRFHGNDKILPHVITSAFEHHAVLDVVRNLEKRGLIEATYIKPDRNGIIQPESIKQALKKNTVLVSIMYANNEIGTIQPISEIAKEIRNFKSSRLKAQISNKAQSSKSKKLELGTSDLEFAAKYPLLHTDACQAAGYLEMDVNALDVDLLTFNGSKIYGPKGVGVLFAKEGTRITSIFQGGGQESGLRSGTENVPLIVGLATAVKLIRNENHQAEIKLRDYLTAELLKIEDVLLNGHPSLRLPNNVNVSIKGVEGEAAILYLDKVGICVATGSACQSRSLEPSHVIMSMGLGAEQAHTSLRITIGRPTTKAEIDYFLDTIKEVTIKLRKISGMK